MTETLPTVITDHINKHLSDNRSDDPRYPMAPAIRLADGSLWSVQASTGHYCTPRGNDGPYTSVEIMVIEGDIPEQFEGIRNDDGLFGWMPVHRANAAIESAGGISAIVL